jgi:excisionase family DNA binding protein
VITVPGYPGGVLHREERIVIELPAKDAAEAYLTTQELADMLHVHRSYISDLRRTNQGPKSFRFGRLLYTKRSEVMAWLAATEEECAYLPPGLADGAKPAEVGAND